LTTSDVLLVGGVGDGSLTIANGGSVNVGTGGSKEVQVGWTGVVLSTSAPSQATWQRHGNLNAATVNTIPARVHSSSTQLVSYYLTRMVRCTAAVVVGGSTKVINNAGATIFAGANTYTGGTVINGGYS